MRQPVVRALIGYAAAVVAVAVALGLKFLIAPLATTEAPFVFFLGAVLFAGWFGGVGPGVVATLVAAAAADYFFLPPTGSLLWNEHGHDLRLIQFLAEGGFISILSGLRQRSSQQAHNHLEELRVTLRSIGDGVITADRHGRITFLNPVAEELTGWSNEEAAGRPTTVVLHLIHEETRQRVECPILRVLRTGKATGLNNWAVLVARDGTERPVDDTASPIRDQDGQLIGVVMVFRDTTERRQAEAARVETYRRTSAILESIGDAFYALDREWRFTYVNTRAEEFLRRKKEDLLGRVVWEEFPAIVGTELEARYRETVAAGGPARFETRSPTTNRWVEVNAYPSEEGLSVYFRDISDRKAAEEERTRLLAQLEAEQARLRAVLDQLPAGVMVAEAPSGRVVLANPQVDDLLCGMIALPESRADYGEWAVFDSSGRRLNASEFPLAQALDGDVVRAAEFRCPGPGGRQVWLRAYAAPIRDHRGEVTSAVLVLDDVSSEKETEQALRWSHDALLSRLATIAEEERRRLSRELHDETSQQTAALILGLRTARDDPRTGPEVAARLAGLQDVAERIGRSLHHIAYELRPAVLDELGLEAALRDAVGRWSERTGVPADFHGTLGPARLPPDVETHTYRIVSEALTNALKHAGATRVGVLVERRGDDLTAIVEDNGRGFDPEAVRPTSGRTGLGLRGMWERAALMGGTVEVESSPGHGTTVFVRVPLKAADQREP